MDDSDIVEIYSAANSIEAYAMANALKAAGIKARVVGDILEIGVRVAWPLASLLPLGSGSAGKTKPTPADCLNSGKSMPKYRPSSSNLNSKTDCWKLGCPAH